MKVSVQKGVAMDVCGAVDYKENSIVSSEILRNGAGTLTVFAFAPGQGLSEHTAPFDATVHVLEGEAAITIGGVLHTVRAGQVIIMPANVPHALMAEEPFKMMLIMLKDKQPSESGDGHKACGA